MTRLPGVALSADVTAPSAADLDAALDRACATGEAATPTLSVHAYSPPLTAMSYYEVTPGGRLRRVRSELTDEPEGPTGGRGIDELLAGARDRIDRVEAEDLRAELDAGAILVDTRPAAQRAAEIILAVLLFVDATHVRGSLLGRHPRLVLRSLLIGLPVSLALSLTLRFIPVLAQVVQDVQEAQRARGLERNLVALAAPVIVRTLKMADDVADAIDARS